MMDDVLAENIKLLCAKKSWGVKKRLDAPKDFPLSQQSVIVAKTGVDGIKMTSGFMFEPVKTDLGENVHGFYQYYKRGMVIYINDSLDEHMQLQVLRHEIGHAVLHRKTVNSDKLFKQLVKRIFAVQIFSVT